MNFIKKLWHKFFGYRDLNAYLQDKSNENSASSKLVVTFTIIDSGDGDSLDPKLEIKYAYDDNFASYVTSAYGLVGSNNQETVAKFLKFTATEVL